MSTAAPETRHRATTSEDDLDALVEQIVDSFPPLSDERKAELGRLLAPSAA
jgi:hypothetical protein